MFIKYYPFLSSLDRQQRGCCPVAVSEALSTWIFRLCDPKITVHVDNLPPLKCPNV